MICERIKKLLGILVFDKILNGFFKLFSYFLELSLFDFGTKEIRFISKPADEIVSFIPSNNRKETAAMLRWNFNFKISCKMVAVIAYDIRSLYLMACIIWRNRNVNTESQFGTQSWLAGKFRSFQACVGNSCACLHKMSLVNFLKFGEDYEFVYMWLCG